MENRIKKIMELTLELNKNISVEKKTDEAVIVCTSDGKEGCSIVAGRFVNIVATLHSAIEKDPILFRAVILVATSMPKDKIMENILNFRINGK